MKVFSFLSNLCCEVKKSDSCTSAHSSVGNSYPLFDRVLSLGSSHDNKSSNVQRRYIFHSQFIHPCDYPSPPSCCNSSQRLYQITKSRIENENDEGILRHGILERIHFIKQRFKFMLIDFQSKLDHVRRKEREELSKVRDSLTHEG